LWNHCHLSGGKGAHDFFDYGGLAATGATCYTNDYHAEWVEMVYADKVTFFCRTNQE
jgi:hypothetical protein